MAKRTTTNESVVSIDLSRELLKQLREARRKAERSRWPDWPLAPIMPMKGRYARITLQTKWAWKWAGCRYCGHERRIEYSGGVSLTVSAPAPRYGGRSVEKTWRLVDGWKAADYDRMVARATTWGIRELRLIEYREQLERAFDGLTEARKDAAHAHAQAAGWPVMYAEMSTDDCGRWLDWLKEETK